jgi:diguanylate cyclase (GGDEF)-like protein
MNSQNKVIQSDDSFTLINVLLVLTMVTVIAMMVYLFGQLEKSSQENQKERIEIALELEQRRLNDFLHDYAYWDESYQRQIASIDPDWVDDNSGKYLFDTFGFNMTIAMTGDHKTMVEVFDGEIRNEVFDEALTTELKKIIERAKSADDFSLRNLFINFDSRVYLIGYAFFRDETTEKIRQDHAYLIFGKRIDEAFLAQLSETFRLPLIQLGQAGRETDKCCFIAFKDVDQNELARIYWQQADLSRYLFQVIFFLILITMVIILLIRMILKSNEKQKNDYLRILHDHAHTDELTGISNRRHFLNKAAQEIRRCGRSGQAISLLLLDLDFFKNINDQHGHAVGDIVLSEVSEAIEPTLRSFDIFARYGGEEFVILLPDTEQKEAFEVAERVRTKIESMEIVAGRQSIRCTASLGVAELKADEPLELLISRADEALYQAKNAGRNRTITADAV